MARLQIENFGPVKKCDIEISLLTVLVGNQGTGKSTVAKLYSSLVWLEKACRIQECSCGYCTSGFCACGRLLGH